MISTPAGLIRHPPALTSSEQQSVRTLARAVEDLDGAEPLNEQSLLHLGVASSPPLHVVVSGPHGDIVGYAQVDLTLPPTAEILLGPVEDRVGLGDLLIAAAEELARPTPVLLWARGRSPVTVAATTRGYAADRILLTLRRPLAGLSVEPVEAPAGITVRTFVPGADDAAWLAVNAAAFATHPEQGAWTEQDLLERLDQPWFDPSGFFLAVDEQDTLLGYHWTKLHEPARPDEPPLGEVYVLGISPNAQGRGLGRVLLDAGLRHLAAGPAQDVILYVEESNATAVRLYERGGFAVDRRDIQFRGPDRTAGSALSGTAR